MKINYENNTISEKFIEQDIIYVADGDNNLDSFSNQQQWD
jgi:hypothetical protein